MKRRQFITLLGGAAAWPRATRAQQPAMPVIGFLHPASPDGYGPYVAALRHGLQDTGYAEGQNLTIEFRWGEDHAERLPALATDLVRRQVALIFAGGNTAAIAARAASAAIPIVFASANDPVKVGLVASLNRPGGNATGMLQFSDVLIAKRLELLRELVPKAPVIGWLVNPDSAAAEPETRSLQAAARDIGQEIRILHANGQEQFDAVFATIVRERIAGLIVQNIPVFTNGRERLAALAAHRGVPAIYEVREFTAAGGLISYGSSLVDAYRQAGIYVGRILKGEKPADLPVVQPTKFDLVINLKTAKALALTIPESFLLRADEVIE